MEVESVKWVADGTFLAATGEKLLSCDIANGDSPLKVSGHLDLHLFEVAFEV